MKDFQHHKFKYTDIKVRRKDQINEDAKGKATADRVVKKVLDVWKNSFSDSDDQKGSYIHHPLRKE